MDAIDAAVLPISWIRIRDGRGRIIGFTIAHVDRLLRIGFGELCRCARAANGTVAAVADGVHRFGEMCFIPTRSCHRVTASFCILSYECPQLADHSNPVLLALLPLPMPQLICLVNRTELLVHELEHGQFDGFASVSRLCDLRRVKRPYEIEIINRRKTDSLAN